MSDNTSNNKYDSVMDTGMKSIGMKTKNQEDVPINSKLKMTIVLIFILIFFLSIRIFSSNTYNSDLDTSVSNLLLNTTGITYLTPKTSIGNDTTIDGDLVVNYDTYISGDIYNSNSKILDNTGLESSLSITNLSVSGTTTPRFISSWQSACITTTPDVSDLTAGDSYKDNTSIIPFYVNLTSTIGEFDVLNPPRVVVYYCPSWYPNTDLDPSVDIFIPLENVSIDIMSLMFYTDIAQDSQSSQYMLSGILDVSKLVNIYDGNIAYQAAISENIIHVNNNQPPLNIVYDITYYPLAGGICNSITNSVASVTPTLNPNTLNPYGSGGICVYIY